MLNDINDPKARKAEYKEALKQFEQLSGELAQTYRAYNGTSSAAEMDGYISKINELRSRRNRILGQLRQMEPSGKEHLWKSYQAFS